MRVLALLEGAEPTEAFASLGWVKRDAPGSTLRTEILVDQWGVVVGAWLGRVEWGPRLQDWLRQQASVNLYPLIVLSGDTMGSGAFLDEVSRYASVDLVMHTDRVAEYLAKGGFPNDHAGGR